MVYKKDADRTSQIGKNLAQARENVGMSQRDAADSLGVHYMTLSKYELGKTKKIPGDLLERASDLYRVALNDVLSGEIKERRARGVSENASAESSAGEHGIDFWKRTLRAHDDQIEREGKTADRKRLSEMRDDFAKATRMVFHLEGAAAGPSLDETVEFFVEIRFRNIDPPGDQKRKEGGR